MDKETQPSEYRILQFLGKGGYSSVFRALDQNNKQVAIKKYDPKQSSIEQMLKQAQILKQLKHPNVVEFIACKQNAIITKQNGQTQKCWALIMEYPSGGQLYQMLLKGGRFDQKMARTYFYQIICALRHIHNSNYVHLDIKPTNILLTNKYKLKLIDFGFSSRKINQNGSLWLTQYKGTEQFMAPQITNNLYEGTKVDIFAAGVTLFQLISRNPPFFKAYAQDYNYKYIMSDMSESFWRKIRKQDRFKNVVFSDDFKNLFIKMVQYKPQNRITIDEILKHPWMKGSFAKQHQIQEYFQIVQNMETLQTQTEYQQEKKYQKVLYDAQYKFSTIRGSGDLSNEFLELLMEEKHKERKLIRFEQTLKNDMVLDSSDPIYLVAKLKYLLKGIQIHLSQSMNEKIDYDQIHKDNLLRFDKMTENEQNQIQAQFKYQTTQEQDDIIVKVKVTIGCDFEDRVKFRFQMTMGSYCDLNRILNVVKRTFAYKIYHLKTK